MNQRWDENDSNWENHGCVPLERTATAGRSKKRVVLVKWLQLHHLRHGMGNLCDSHENRVSITKRAMIVLQTGGNLDNFHRWWELLHLEGVKGQAYCSIGCNCFGFQHTTIAMAILMNASMILSKERGDVQRSSQLPTRCLYTALEDGYGLYWAQMPRPLSFSWKSEFRKRLHSCNGKPKAAPKVVSQEREDWQRSLKLPTECLYAALEDGYGS